MQNLMKVIFALLFVLISYKTYAAETVLNCDGLIFKRDKPFFAGKAKYYERRDGEWINYCNADKLTKTYTKDSAKCVGMLVRPTQKEIEAIKDYFAETEYRTTEVIDFLANTYSIRRIYNFKPYFESNIKCKQM